MAPPRMRRNIGWNLAEVIASAVVLFVLYRVVITRLGIDALGAWSLVAATTSLGRAFDLGAAGGLARYVALSDGKRESRDQAATYVDSAVLLNIGIYLAIALAMYLPASWSLSRVTHGAAEHQVQALLPWSLAAFALASIFNVIASALIGFGRSDVKSAIVIFGVVGQALVALIAVPRLGLVGLALAQISQFLVQLLVGWMFVVRQIHGRFQLRAPLRWSRAALRELLGFGVRLQTINLVGFLHEPAIRYVFAAVGGVAMLGYYEMAARCVSQIRAVLSAPTQNLVPMFAKIGPADREQLVRTYEVAVAGLAATSLVSLGGFAAATPIVSLLWIGEVKWEFVTYAVICSAGWFPNLLAIPAFYLGIGLNHLRWNVGGAFATTLLSPLMAYVLGVAFGRPGLVAGAMIGVSVGALITMVMNSRAFGLNPLPRLSRTPSILREAIQQIIRPNG